MIERMRMAPLALLAALCLGCANSPAERYVPQWTGSVYPDDIVEGQARVLAVGTEAGCGVLLIGTPVTYEVLSGPASGFVVTAYVPCLEMGGLHEGDVHAFASGQVHRIWLSRGWNRHRIEVPNPLPKPGSYYLLSAWTVATP